LKGTIGKLDGVTLMRYAHIFKEPSGGIELYLGNLNRMLLIRNKMTILQMYLVNDVKGHNVEVEEVGRGNLIWIPCHLLKRESHDFTLKNLYSLLLEAGILNFQLRLLKYFRNRYVLLQKGVLDSIRDYKIDLISFHWLNYDSKNIVASAVKNGIPYVFINHFENDVYNREIVKRQIINSCALAGVSSVNVPEHIRHRFTDLLDGVDTEFFDTERAKPPETHHFSTRASCRAERSL
jgi:hypothetical protein